MSVKKFTANSSREAWRQVRLALGPEAIILSNRNTQDGVEILAMAAEDMASLLGSHKADRAALSDAHPHRAMAPPTAASCAWQTQNNAAEQLTLGSVKYTSGEARVWRSRATAASMQQQLANSTAQHGLQDPDQILSGMMMEIRSMRGVLETRLAEISWSDTQKREPMKATMMKEMLTAGFSASLSRLIADNLPSKQPQDMITWVKAVLVKNLSVMANEDHLLAKGGVYALVGPTGVGKTTITAKLAARYVLRYGPGKLALLTTDSHRAGSYEQLRTYAKALGVMVHSIKDESDLRIALDELKGKHFVLIDTPGMGQRDHMVVQQAAMLSSTRTTIKRLLCFNATATYSTLDEVVRAYGVEDLAGCIITKLDEAVTIGNVLDVLMRHKLCLYYIANGQRVPEDLHVANKLYLADRAFKYKYKTAPFEFQDAELPIVAGPATVAMQDKSLQELVLG